MFLDFIQRATNHLTAEEVYNEIKKEYPTSNIGIATVYRALSFLEEVDLITSITFGTDGKKYETNSKSHHDHLQFVLIVGKLLNLWMTI